MLRELYIENLAVIEQMHVDFKDGMTVFTGETGAGKSILIDAINLVLGQRATKDIVRTGTQKAHVSAVFERLPRAAEDKLREFGLISENGEMIISREIGADGRGNARLMGRPVTVSMLRELGTMLINIHGQHDNQILLSSENHIDIIDAFSGAAEVYRDYRTVYDEFVALKRRYRKLDVDEQEKARRIDLLTYQIEEISAVSPKSGEDDALEEKLGLIRNAAKISDTLKEAYVLLRGIDDDGGAYDNILQSCGLLEDIAGYNAAIAKLAEQLQSIRYELEETSEGVSDFLERFEFDAGELEQLEQRREELSLLKRKYGSTIDEVLEFYENASRELEQIKLSEDEKLALYDEMESQKERVVKAGQKLTAVRMKAARRFSAQVSEQLTFLDMPNVSMKVRIEKTRYSVRGCDDVEILFSTNKGEELKSISKIASGGELSRIMLAMKSVLAEHDAIDTLIFDEIDTGVSGSSAQKIGLKLKEVAAHRQVLCVTHSAQIAALSQHNFLIQKQTEKGRTYTRISSLCAEEKVREVARIMSTGEITDLLLQNAREMVEAGER